MFVTPNPADPKITIKGLRLQKKAVSHSHDCKHQICRCIPAPSTTGSSTNEEVEGQVTYETVIPKAWLKLQPNHLGDEIQKLGFQRPSNLNVESTNTALHVVGEGVASSYDACSDAGLCIQQNETFASWWTQAAGGHQNAEITSTSDGVSVYGTSTSFQRTLRVPDTGKSHSLPPSLGSFPVTPVKDHRDTEPEIVAQRGGYILPMYQREAMWLRFSHAHGAHNAMKVSVGGINALTGALKGEKGQPGVQDYLCESQPWLDGIVKEEGKVRQFVSMPVGEGYTIEEQLTGKNSEATLQLDIFPAFRKDVQIKVDGEDVKITKTPADAGVAAGGKVDFRPRSTSGLFKIGDHLKFQGKNLVLHAEYRAYGVRGGASGSFYGAGPMMPMAQSFYGAMPEMALSRGRAPKSVSVGIAAGGSIAQKINKDDEDTDIYDFEAGKRIYIHFINAGAWKQVTGKDAPVTPVDKNSYKNHNIPWFELYNEPEPAKGQGEGFKNIKTVNDIDTVDKKNWDDIEAGDRITSSSTGTSKLTDDEQLFNQRWEEGQGKIIDYDASNMKGMGTSATVHPKPLVRPTMPPGWCVTPPFPFERDSGDKVGSGREHTAWTYAQDNVSSLSK